jgi:replicative DNA helicase
MNMSFEQALIGTVLSEPDAYLDVYDVIPTDFADQSHNTIWKYVTKLFEKGALSEKTVTETLRADDMLDSLGDTIRGEEYIQFLVTQADTTGVKEFGFQVMEASVKRELEKVGRLLAIAAGQEGESAEIIEDHVKQILLLRRANQKDPIAVGELLPGFDEKLINIKTGKIEPYWYPPVQAIRDVLYHMSDVDFQVLVGQPAKGKSSLLRFDAISTALNGEKVLTLTLENSEEECLSWGMAQLSGVNHYHVVDPKKITNKEQEYFEEARERIQQIPWFVQEVGMVNISELIAKIRRFKLQHPDLKLIQIDGLYLVSGKSDSVYESISDTTQKLRSLAQDLHVPIQGTTQFNRGVKNKNEPTLDDLLYAGENPARQVCAIMNPPLDPHIAALFPENKDKEGKLMAGNVLNAVVMKVKVLKNTSGQTGTTGDIKWIKPTQTFQSLQHDWKGDVKPMKTQPKEDFQAGMEQKPYGHPKPTPKKKKVKYKYTN